MAMNGSGQKKNPPSANRAPRASTRDTQLHQAQRTLMHNALRQNGEKRLSANSDAYHDIVGQYGVRANGQTLAEFKKQVAARENQMLQDAQNIRSQRKGEMRNNPQPKALKDIGSGKRATKPAQAKSGGGAVDRSEAVKRAWETRRKNYGDSGRKS